QFARTKFPSAAVVLGKPKSAAAFPSSDSTAMATQLGQPSPAVAPAKYDPAATYITAIGDDLLREIFLRLPSLPSLVRAALACRTFLRAVRSSPAFRRRFRALHPPQILGYFTVHYRTAIPAFVPLRSRSDRDLAAVVRGSDFFFTRLPEDGDDTRWASNGKCSGYVFIHNQRTDQRQISAYNPLTQALNVFPYPPQEACDPSYLDFRIIFSEDDRRSFRVVCVRHRRRRLRTLARLSVFSSDSREWQGFPWVDTSVPQPRDDGGDKCLLSSYTATPVDEFDRLVYWKHKNQAYIVVLNAATLQLSRIDLPPHLKDMDSIEFKLGPTKDGKLCMSFTDHFAANEGMLNVWFWRADGDGVDKWMSHKIFPLSKFVDFSMCSEEYAVTAQVKGVIDDFVHLSVYYLNTKFFLSFCLETEKVNKLFEYGLCVDPYIMPWPSS
uniref:F-box protein AT5G49610-like beta-propeller domain-containing protein n=1 Tax=Aegilops tauschii subsp. strangulata TaxID=200361 RepID=A0A453LIH6_AEGTS